MSPVRKNALAIASAGVAILVAILALVAWGQEGAVVLSAVATAGATVVLAWVTASLVRVTRDMATNPAVVPSLWFTSHHVFLELHNAGDGAAIDLEVTIEWKLGRNVDAELVTPKTQWRAAILPAGGRVRFNPPRLKAGWLENEALGIFDRVVVTGTMSNSRGETMPVNTAVREPMEVWDFELEARRQLPQNYEPDEIVAEQAKAIAKQLERIARLLSDQTATTDEP